ncbi:unnamed protein product [Tuber aestivum]|uniref:Uncharacterized protein n=1 Tax=Tuber aestivum TaxID=59557 RepID=A0A292PNH6_9PEZI|nr:unnamed protein product [Tuber aestivum]
MCSWRANITRKHNKLAKANFNQVGTLEYNTEPGIPVTERMRFPLETPINRISDDHVERILAADSEQPWDLDETVGNVEYRQRRGMSTKSIIWADKIAHIDGSQGKSSDLPNANPTSTRGWKRNIHSLQLAEICELEIGVSLEITIKKKLPQENKRCAPSVNGSILYPY